MKQERKHEPAEEDVRLVKDVDQSSLYRIAGVPVHFPFNPYASQLDMMSHMIHALNRSQNSMLESPTGSGKSLALLCAALGWRKNFTAKLRLSRINVRNVAMRYSQRTSASPQPLTEKNSTDNGSGRPDVSTKALPHIVDRILYEAANGKIPAGLDKSDLDALRDYQQNYAHIKHPPTIYFGSRTHKQVSQLVRELRDKTPYRVAMAILGSRKQECIHPSARKASSVDEACNELRVGGKCEYLGNYRKLVADESIAPGGKNEIWDIEDIVSLGKSANACPYYASHELAKTAALVFCPYNYIVDPIVRSAVKISLDDNIVILDEAHNIEGATRDAASVEIIDFQLARLVRECKDVLDVTGLHSTYSRVMRMAKTILAWLRDKSNVYKFQEATMHSTIWPTPEASLTSVLEQLGFTEVSVSQLELDCNLLEEDAKNPKLVNRYKGQSPQIFHLSGPSLRLIKSLVLVLKRICPAVSSFKDDYRLARIRNFPLGNSTLSESANLSSATNTLALWAMSPGILFSELSQKCRSIVLTSGTLSPLSSYASELRTEFASSLEANHVISPDRFLAMCIQCGPSGNLLEGKYANVNEQTYQDDIGQAVASIAAKCPDGMLVFVPSYSLLRKLIARWKETGEMDSISRHKKMFIESQGDSNYSFARLLAQYKEFLGNGHAISRNSYNADAQGGAVIFAVYRGKVSEGLDFSDHLCRTIVNVGIPYPSFMDAKITLKREYNDAHNSANGESGKDGYLLSGFSWYNTQAFRAINQALGRCLRHKNDWGAIILLDSRMAIPRNTFQLSKWIRSHIQSYSEFHLAAQDLDTFYKRRTQEDVEDSLTSDIARLAVN